jgi:transposase
MEVKRSYRFRLYPKRETEEKMPKTLAQRWHHCPYCGLEMHRDLNSARNILTEGTSGKYACGDGNSALGEHSLSKNQEASNGSPPVWANI